MFILFINPYSYGCFSSFYFIDVDNGGDADGNLPTDEVDNSGAHLMCIAETTEKGKQQPSIAIMVNVVI